MKAEEFDAKFDAGEDLTEFMDFSTARRPNREKQKIELNLPLVDDSPTGSRSSKTGHFSPNLFRKLFG